MDDYFGAAIIGMLIGAFVTFAVMMFAIDAVWKERAVVHGCAEYRIESKAVVFHWKDDGK